MRKYPLIAALLAASCFVFAQAENDDNNNVAISSSTRIFRFVSGNNDNPVQVKEESSRVYTCLNYRTVVPFAEFYSEVETIDDVDIVLNKSKRHGLVPNYEYYNADGVFYSDAHVCYFNLPLAQKGSTSEVTIKKTTLDPHYFTKIFLMEPQQIQEQEIKIIVPSWMMVELKEYNFGAYDIKKTVATSGNETTHTYRLKNIPALMNETSAPGSSYYAPHLLVLCKSATPKETNYTYFNTLKDQYNWYRKLVLQIGNDQQQVKEKAQEIVKGINTDEDKVKAVFLWVQDNIRYIAFENGLAGFKPEKAQEVLRKKYGDCKGMANLLTEMLLSLKLDARRCWIGTKHIAYDYSTPSLSVDNHMIAAWINKGKPVFLDATEKYIGFGEVAERIQGRQTLMEDGDAFKLDRVPVATFIQNTATEKRSLEIEGNNIKGHIKQVWKGENKEWMLTSLNNIKQDKQENALKKYLAAGSTNFDISNLKITNLNDYNSDLNVEYDIVWKDVLSVFDKETYVDLDNRRNLAGFKIDTAKRKLPYWFHFKDHIIFETEIKIPADKFVEALPEKLTIKQPGYSFTGNYSSNSSKLLYTCELILHKTELAPQDFTQWNKDIEQLNNFYNQQIVLTLKK